MVRPNSTSPVLDHSAVRRVPADLATGQGLDVAMKGVTGVYVIAPNVDDSEVDMARHVVESAVAKGFRGSPITPCCTPTTRRCRTTCARRGRND